MTIFVLYVPYSVCTKISQENILRREKKGIRSDIKKIVQMETGEELEEYEENGEYEEYEEYGEYEEYEE